MARAAIGNFNSLPSPAKYDPTNEAQFRRSIERWTANLVQVVTADPLGPAGIPVLYDPTTSTLNVTGNLNVTGAATLGTPLAVTSGGTGRNTLTNKALLVGVAASAISFLSPGAVSTVVRSNGTDWQAQQLAFTDISGTLAYAQLPTGGGTWANGGNLSITGGNVTVPKLISTGAEAAVFGDSVSNGVIRIIGTSGFVSAIYFNAAGTSADSGRRWLIERDTVAESGANAGSGFILLARDDAGAAIDTVLTITRAAGGTIAWSGARPMTALALTLSSSSTSALALINATAGITVNAGGAVTDSNQIQFTGLRAVFGYDGVNSQAYVTGASGKTVRIDSNAAEAVRIDRGNTVATELAVTVGNSLTTEQLGTSLRLRAGTNAGANDQTSYIQFLRSSTSLWKTGVLSTTVYAVRDEVNARRITTWHPSATNDDLRVGQDNTTGNVTASFTINRGTNTGNPTTNAVVGWASGNGNSPSWYAGLYGAVETTGRWILFDNVNSITSLEVVPGGGLKIHPRLTTTANNATLTINCGTNAGANNQDAVVAYQRGGTALWEVGVRGTSAADANLRVYNNTQSIPVAYFSATATEGRFAIRGDAATAGTDAVLAVNAGTNAGANNRDAITEYQLGTAAKWRVGMFGSVSTGGNLRVYDVANAVVTATFFVNSPAFGVSDAYTTQNISGRIFVNAGTNAGANDKDSTFEWQRGQTATWRAGILGSVGATANWRLYDVVNSMTAITVVPSATFQQIALNSGATTQAVGTSFAINVGTNAGANNQDGYVSWTRAGVASWFAGILGSVAANSNWTLRDAVNGANAIVITAGATPAITTGLWNATKIGLAYGGTNADLGATGGASQVLKQVSAGAAITVGQLAFADLSGNVTFAQLPTGSGVWDVGVGNVLTLTRSVTFGETTTMNALTYSWPAFQVAGRFLQTDGVGNLSWATLSVSAALSGLTDTQIVSPLDRDVLMYNANTGRWQNRRLHASDIEGVLTFSLTDQLGEIPGTFGEVLYYGDDGWEARKVDEFIADGAFLESLSISSITSSGSAYLEFQKQRTAQWRFGYISSQLQLFDAVNNYTAVKVTGGNTPAISVGSTAFTTRSPKLSLFVGGGSSLTAYLEIARGNTAQWFVGVHDSASVSDINALAMRDNLAGIPQNTVFRLRTFTQVINNNVFTAAFYPDITTENVSCVLGLNAGTHFGANDKTAAISYQRGGAAMWLAGLSGATWILQDSANIVVLLTATQNGGIQVGSPTGGDKGLATLNIAGDLYTKGSTFLVRTTAALTNNAGVAAGTLGNAPAAGDPTKWIAIDDNGTTRYVPAW